MHTSSRYYKMSTIRTTTKTAKYSPVCMVPNQCVCYCLVFILVLPIPYASPEPTTSTSIETSELRGQRQTCAVKSDVLFEDSFVVTAALWQDIPPNSPQKYVAKYLSLTTTYTAPGDTESNEANGYKLDITFTSTSTISANLKIIDTNYIDGITYYLLIHISFIWHEDITLRCNFTAQSQVTSAIGSMDSTTSSQNDTSDYLGTTTPQRSLSDVTQKLSKVSARPKWWPPTTNPSISFKQGSTTKPELEPNMHKEMKGENSDEKKICGTSDVYKTVTIVLSVTTIVAVCIVVAIVFVLRKRGHFSICLQTKTKNTDEECVEAPPGVQHTMEDIESAQPPELVHLKINTDSRDSNMMKSIEWKPPKYDKNESVFNVDCR
ncbi:uncharacterized protein LOC144440223 [Glandiceps talaboti]